jgi:hypothetical protein
MDSVMKGLFGGGDFDTDEKVTQANDFVKRVEEGEPSEGFSDEEAVEYYKKVSAGASPEELQKATQQAVDRLNPEQREEFAKMMQERASGQVAQREGAPAGGDGGAGLDDILGSILGGGSGGSGGSGGGGLGDIFGSLLGGGATTDTGATAGGGGGGFDLGDLMKSPAAKAVIGGIAAFAMKEMLNKK